MKKGTAATERTRLAAAEVFQAGVLYVIGYGPYKNPPERPTRHRPAVRRPPISPRPVRLVQGHHLLDALLLRGSQLLRLGTSVASSHRHYTVIDDGDNAWLFQVQKSQGHGFGGGSGERRLQCQHVVLAPARCRAEQPRGKEHSGGDEATQVVGERSILGARADVEFA